MGKRSVIKQQASSKISKKDHRHHRQHHHHLQAEFNSLINDLKPKVYITDPSSFKQLVQDLTGNNNSGNPNIPSTISSSSSKVHDAQVQQFSVERSVSTEAPTTTTATTTTSSEEFCHNDDNNNDMMNDTDELMMMCKEYEEDIDGLFFCRSNNNNQMMVQISEENDTVFEDILACDYDQINYLESLLFDDHNQVVVEQQPFISDPFYTQMIQPAEISVYDYDFSGLINY